MTSGAEAPEGSQRAARRGGGARAEEGRFRGALNGNDGGKGGESPTIVFAFGEER